MKKGWEIKTLGEVCEVIAGGDVPKNNFSKIRTEKYQIPIYTNGEKNKGLYGFTSMPRICKTSITVSARGTIGYIELREEPFYPAIRLIAITPKHDNINTFYLKYAISRLIISSSGTSIPQLTVPMFKKYKIPIPTDKEEQKEIVKKLDKGFELIDSLKETAKKNLDNAKELFKSVLREELSPKEGWETKTLKSSFNIKTGKLNSNEAVENGEYPFFTCSRETFKINSFSFDCNAVLLAGNNASGDFNVKYYNGKFDTYQRTYVITSIDESLFDIRYLYFRLILALQEFKDMSLGANTKFIKLGMIENIMLNDISIKEQEEIVGRLDLIKGYCEELEGNYKRVLELCEELKQGLLREAFEVR